MSNKLTNHTELKKSGNFLTNNTKLSDEDKAIAEKAAKMIADEYGDVIKELGE